MFSGTAIQRLIELFDKLRLKHSWFDKLGMTMLI